MNYLDFFSLPMDSAATVMVSLSIGVSSVGVALAYYIGDPRSPATRALAFAVAMVGVANATYPAQHILHPDGVGTWWLVGLPVLDAGVMVGLLLWMLCVARSAQPTAAARLWLRRCAVVFSLVTLSYLALGAWLPVERMSRFLFCLGHAQGCSGPYFWTFAIPIGLMGTLVVVAGLIVFGQRMDEAERQRVACVAVAAPFFFLNYVLPAGYNVLTSLPGLFFFLLGGIRYHTVQGERGRLLSRFLSREVVEQVALRGLAYTLKPQKLELTVICCDLRGFTQFSNAHDSNVVTRLLGEYYDAVGNVAAEFQATILAYSGDGIMIAVGAPIPVPGHAQRGLALSHRVLLAAEAITRHWSRDDCPLAVGVGVSSGVVTVGAIGSSSRMEYTAIGTAANLASRLCALALGGEILVDVRTAELTGTETLEARGAVHLKGMGDVMHYAHIANDPAYELGAGSARA